jgi:hypothetical protein
MVEDGKRAVRLLPGSDEAGVESDGERLAWRRKGRLGHAVIPGTAAGS